MPLDIIGKLARPALAGLLGGCALTGVSSPATGEPVYPDPLTVEEHWRVLEILHDADRIDGATRFSRIALAPIDKHAPGPRQAELIIKQGADTIEALVDLEAGQVAEWEVVENAQAPWLYEEYIGPVVAAVKAHPDFQAALERRGIERPEFIQCRTSPPGNFGEERFAGRRLAAVRCFPAGPESNKYPRRVEGLLIFADMNTYEILEIRDYEVIPIPDTYADYDDDHESSERAFPTPAGSPFPEGPGYEVDGNIVTWDQWRFHIRSDQRVGIVISQAEWKDGDAWRPVLHEGHLSEISVPYMAPQGDWYLRNPIDAGEYSAGGLSDPLTPGVHCPAHATFMDGLIVNDRGYPQTKPDTVCLFERATGDPLWLHDVEGRQDRNLVARMAARLGNYDYIVDWVFSSDGQIQIRLGATGIVAIMNTLEQDATSPVIGENAPDAYGRFVDDHVVAVNHSHYFNFRMDLDVDGPTNNFHKGDVVTRRLPESHVRKSIWVYEDEVLGDEEAAKLSGMGLWRVGSTDQTNGVGYPTSYQIMPGMNARTKLTEDDWARSRAGFVDNVLWVTRYKPDERYAAGDYPTLSTPGEGLPDYSDGEDIAGQDIVVWYTMGMHHVVRAEDWPIMPVLWHDVTLRPFDFFDSNAATALPPTVEE
ncbi:MAG: hypothetical protein MRY64_14385 [Hyphomonadaceae bacterium]|nr:hypothetical protein [Hyphomonadaceae bacterium]